MKPFMFVSFFVFFPLGLIAQKITMESVPLHWSDFRLSENQHLPYTAHISTNIRYKVSSKIESGNILYLLSSESLIDRSSSTVSKDFIENASLADREKLLYHEKGHLIISYIHHKKFQDLIKAYKFKGPLKREVDSLFSAMINDMKEMDRNYDLETRHGINSSQGEWEKILLSQLNGLYNIVPDFFAPTETVMVTAGNLRKMNDPLKLSYDSIISVFEYYFVGNVVDSSILNTHYTPTTENRISIDTNNNMHVKEVDFDKDFEIELAFKIGKPARRNRPCLAIYWGFTDSAGSTWLAIAPARMKLTYCRGGDHKKDKGRNIYLYPRLGEDICQVTIRRTKDKYYIFVNGKFEKELPSVPLLGKELVLRLVKNNIFIHNMKLFYFN
jgi:hypothetical protein